MIGSLLSIGLASFLFAISSTEDLKYCFGVLNENATVKRNGIFSFTQLTELLQYHADVQKLSSFENG